MRNIMKRFTTTTLCLCALVIAEPQVPSKSYLPPEEGYSYGAPSVPFPSPSPSPTPTSYYTQPTYRPSVPSPRPRPPSVSPTYPSIPSTYQPSYQPAYSTPKPFARPSPQPTYGVPSYEQSGSAISASGIGGDTSQGTGGGEFDHLKVPHVPSMPYDFSYAVKDDYYGTDFAHSANSNGDQVRGEYRVQLPDGRLQIVKYIADWKDGYTAEVTYQGEAKYPQTPGGSGSSIGPVGYPGAKPQPSGGYPSGKPSGGYGGANYGGAGFSQPTAGYPSSQPTIGYPSQPTAGYPSQPTAGYPSQPTAGYPSSQPTAGYAGSQPSYSAQPISGYGGAQQSAGGYSNPQQTYSAPDYGSY